ncbi:MAG: PTS mannose/fructose/sorbose transporter family subunit IID [Elusimicrobia bacterium]|nr:PTS mannose/fructose/sorbose transporter family subunit IID [Elusimicrobiota bacterium]
MTLPRRDLVRIFFRSFLIQGLWTVQRVQNLGYLYSLWPVFRRLYPKREDRAYVGRFHAGYFSTHPYASGILIGVVAGLETDLAEGRGPKRDAILTARSAMSGPLSALGESFFWGTWLPFCAVFCWVLNGSAIRSTGWTIVLFVGLFNLPHLWVRSVGLWLGYRWKTEVVPHLVLFRVQKMLPYLAVGGMALAVWQAASIASGETTVVQGLLWTVFFWGTLRLGVRPSFVALAVAGLSMAFAWGKTLL